MIPIQIWSQRFIEPTSGLDEITVLFDVTKGEVFREQFEI
jgi:hypothetical protein